MRVRHATRGDLPQIVAIYNEAIVTSVATFDHVPYSVAERESWFAQFDERHPIFVCEAEDGTVAGFAYYLPFRPKAGYDRTKETTIYVAPGFQRMGVGRQLYERLIAHAREREVHVLVAVLGGNNEPSVALHAKFGFRLAGHYPEVGFKFGHWVDTYTYLLTL